MRYIRTKDGIFDNWLMDGVIPERISAQSFGIEAIKYADTIEELCDEFVVYDADIKRCHILDKGFYHRFDEECKKALYIANRYIYGAIWTDKGLIFVAKMNERGELELL